MRSHNKRFAAACLIAFVLLIVLSLLVVFALYQRAESRCVWNLRGIRDVFGLYVNGHQGKWPASIGDAMRFVDAPAGIMSCPGAEGHGLGYIYINWQKRIGRLEWGSGAFPVIYDDSMGNHWHRGVNVMLSNGDIFWDPHGEWLSRFAAVHPNDRLPIPR